MTSLVDTDVAIDRDRFQFRRQRARAGRQLSAGLLLGRRTAVMGIVILLIVGLGASVGLQLQRDHAQALSQTEEALNAQVATLALALRGLANPERLARVVQDSVAQLPEGMALSVIGPRAEIIASSSGERAIQAALARLAREARSASGAQIHYIETLDDRLVLGAAAAIPGTDLVLAAGSPVSYVLSAWEKSLPLYLMLLAGPAVMMLALAILLVREMERPSARRTRPGLPGFGGHSGRAGTGAHALEKPLAAALPIGFSLWDKRGRLIEMNDRFKAHYNLESRAVTLGELASQPGVVPASLADEMSVTGFADLSEPGLSLLRCGEKLLLQTRKALPSGDTVLSTIDVSGLRLRSEAYARAEQDLSAERARAESAEREKTGLFTSASHELRTPLNAILGFSEIMKDGVLGPLGHDRYREYARDIHESGHRLLRLVDGILTMSEVEKGEASLTLGPVDPSAIARECLIDLGDFAKERRVDLIGRLVLVPDVYADASALRQVFIHLITNALRRSSSGGRVELWCESGSDDVRFTLKNFGPLSSEIDLKRATLGAGNNRSNAGLGLAIAKSLIQLQGGELTVANESDGSITVAFTLPRHSSVARREIAA